MARNYDLAAKTDRIVESVKALSLSDLPAWRALEEAQPPNRLFDFALNRPTFLPDEQGKFSGQALVTLHRDSELSAGHRVVAAKTLFATIVGHLAGDDVKIDDVRFRPT